MDKLDVAIIANASDPHVEMMHEFYQKPNSETLQQVAEGDGLLILSRRAMLVVEMRYRGLISYTDIKK